MFESSHLKIYSAADNARPTILDHSHQIFIRRLRLRGVIGGVNACIHVAILPFVV